MKKVCKSMVMFIISITLVLAFVACQRKSEVSMVSTPESTEQLESKETELTTVSKYEDEEMIKLELKGKSFQMGSTAEKHYGTPIHEVTFTRDIYISDHEVTIFEWEKVMERIPVRCFDSEPMHPVHGVTWYAAIAYCNKRSILEGLDPVYSVTKDGSKIDWVNLEYYGDVPAAVDNDLDWDKVECDFTKNGYRLPTEAEWEYAARGGEFATDKDVWAGTNDITKLEEYALYNVRDLTSYDVKQKKPNAYGLYDMSGSMWEWCWDWFENYDASEVTDPVGPSVGSYRIIRGGCIAFSEGACRVSHRDWTTPGDDGLNSIGRAGFRVVRTSM